MNIPIINSKRGYFITFEGSDGAGKSTQIDLLRQALKHHGFTVRMLREPGGCRISEDIRSTLKEPMYKEMCPETELLLMNAARAQLVREVIKPALAAGEIVLCDRFYHSTIVYQGFGRGLDQNILRAIIQFAIADVTPDVTFVLYLNPAEELKRKSKRGTSDRIEAADEEFQDRVRKGMKWLVDQEPTAKGRIVGIDAGGLKEDIHNEIYRCCVARIGTLKEGALDIAPEKKIIT